MGKSKQVDIFAPSCSAVQLGRKDKPWTGVAGAFVEHQHLVLTEVIFLFKLVSFLEYYMLIVKVEVLKIYIGKQVSSYCKFNND